MRDEHDEKTKLLADLNADILKRKWKLDQDIRHFKDKNLLKRHNDVLMQVRQTHTQNGIDINVYDSRIKDLEGQKQMLEKQIFELQTEKRVVDKENIELEYERQGKGFTEADQKKKQLEAELEMAMGLRKGNEVLKDSSDITSKLLNEEEKKAKDLLDQKITTEQTMEVEQEKADKARNLRRSQRNELIEKKLRLSMLQSTKDQLTAESKVLAESNAKVIAENKDLVAKNEQLAKEIAVIMQRIDVSTLLKQVDLEEMKVLANNNNSMSMAFQGVLFQWDSILKNGEKNVENEIR